MYKVHQKLQFHVSPSLPCLSKKGARISENEKKIVQSTRWRPRLFKNLFDWGRTAMGLNFKIPNGNMDFVTDP